MMARMIFEGLKARSVPGEVESRLVGQDRSNLLDSGAGIRQ